MDNAAVPPETGDEPTSVGAIVADEENRADQLTSVQPGRSLKAGIAAGLVLGIAWGIWTSYSSHRRDTDTLRTKAFAELM